MNSYLHKKMIIVASLALAAGATAVVFGGKQTKGYVAHEWGTFTSVQGSDGVLLDWRPLETSRLPKFVHDLTHPGLNLRPSFIGSKSVVITLQRMETPVIYFYSAEQRTVDVSVRFPQGSITEWYPQASEIGPSTAVVPPVVPKVADCADKSGSTQPTTSAFLSSDGSRKESRISWRHVEILPHKLSPAFAALLPRDDSGGHYFAARDTDAEYLRTSSSSATSSAELEKFIFYRGVGNFGTPLRVTMTSEQEAVLTNTGKETLEHLFVLQLRNQAGNFIHVDHLAPGAQRSVVIAPKDGDVPMAKLSSQLGGRMEESLVQAGLYPREAAAMVKTWRDSWFQEDGIRVLYALPRAWTDRTLPLKLGPAPRELVRVMIGRAEIIPLSMQQQLTDAFIKASRGDTQARLDAARELKTLGRFGEPAVRLATKGAGTNVTQIAWDLLYGPPVNPTEAPAKAF